MRQEDIKEGVEVWGNHQGSVSCWPWIAYWDAQIKYWRMKEEEYPGLVDLSEEGIKVNRWLYVQLGRVDAERWH